MVSGSRIRFVSIDPRPMEWALLSLYHELNGLNNPEVLQCCVGLIHKQVQRMVGPADRFRRLIPVWETVDANLARPWTAAEIAKLASVSEVHLATGGASGAGQHSLPPQRPGPGNQPPRRTSPTARELHPASPPKPSAALAPATLQTCATPPRSPRSGGETGHGARVRTAETWVDYILVVAAHRPICRKNLHGAKMPG